MVQGDVTLINHGTYNLSGGSLKVAADNLNLKPSGGTLHFVPAGEGQVTMLEVTEI